jgi:beta-galactosidase GanA
MLLFLVTLFLTFVAIVGASLYFGKRYLKIHSLGESKITTQDMAFDTHKHGHKITWDKHCFYINSEPIILVSGEFHYWRLPDQSRWKSILMQYKAGGLNCIRIYFHWGYHSPDDGVYLWEGNKDIEYLLTLCEELDLFVLCAPGPYICAETQAGGLPLWMIQKREIRIRHSVITGFRKFDQKFMDCQTQWFDAIMPILARHQITKKHNGCVLAVQIENEVMEEFGGVPIGLADDMKLLCKSARDNGIDVPLFTNDTFENGSFIARKEEDKIHGKSQFGIDLVLID